MSDCPVIYSTIHDYITVNGRISKKLFDKIVLPVLEKTAEIQSKVNKLESENKIMREALEDLLGHVNASLLFPHKDKMDLLQAEIQARETLSKLNGISEDK